MTRLPPPPNSMLDKYYDDEALELYTGRVRVTGGAEHGPASGIVRSDDGALNVELRMPIELGGPGGGSNPEQLLAAGYAACFHGALALLASRAGLELRSITVDAAVTFARDPMDGLFLLSADVRTCLPGVDRTLTAELVRNAERLCPYGKMFRHGIDHLVTASSEPGPPPFGDALPY